MLHIDEKLLYFFVHLPWMAILLNVVKVLLFNVVCIYVIFVVPIYVTVNLHKHVGHYTK